MIKIKKEIFIVFAILIVIIGADIGLEKFTQKNFDEISEQLDLLENKILSENENIINNEKNNEENFDKDIVKSYIDDFEKIHDKWKSKYDFYACFIEHDELEKVELQMVSANASLKMGDFRKAVDEIEKCRFIMKHIEEKDSLRAVNVF